MNSGTAQRNGNDGIVIVGGGLAAQRCAETLRREGYAGRLRILCGEAHPPYDRPPLSKDVLAGTRSEDSVAYRPARWYEQQSIDLLLGVSATSLWPAERRVCLSSGAALHYHRLLIATGSRPRVLPLLSGYENVSVLRTLDDSAALRDVLALCPRLAVIGAGFIGQEVAATARKLDAPVTMIEAGPCPLEGVLGSELGGWFTRLHEKEGVHVITGGTVERVIGSSRVQALRLSTGDTVEVDHVVVGVGVDADTRWLANSGLDVNRGVRVDRHGRTGIDGVFGAGDAAASFDPMLGCHVLGSHWEAAGRQAACAARVMLGLDPGTAPVTSFWTDQYGLRIHYLGRARHTDSVAIDGDPAARNFAATFTRRGRPVAALLVDRPRVLPEFRKLIDPK